MRHICNDVSRSAGEAAEHVSFAELKSTMYKRRRRAQPQARSYRCRPAMLTPSSATVAMRNLTVARFILDSSTLMHGSALIFASDRQLQQLQSATSVFFDATFKVVPHIYYQLFTIIVPHADYAFPALYALMSRKTQSLNAAVFEKVNQLVAAMYAMADFEGAPVATFKSVYVDANVAGCVDY